MDMLPSGVAQLSTGGLRKLLSQAACEGLSEPQEEDASEVSAAAQVTGLLSHLPPMLAHVWRSEHKIAVHEQHAVTPCWSSPRAAR